MGYATVYHEPQAVKSRGPKLTYQRLRRHPRFAFPNAPKTLTDAALVGFIVESIATFVSPPKLEGEHDEFACEDIATAIRKLLKPELLSKVRELRSRTR